MAPLSLPVALWPLARWQAGHPSLQGARVHWLLCCLLCGLTVQKEAGMLRSSVYRIDRVNVSAIERWTRFNGHDSRQIVSTQGGMTCSANYWVVNGIVVTARAACCRLRNAYLNLTAWASPWPIKCIRTAYDVIDNIWGQLELTFY